MKSSTKKVIWSLIFFGLVGLTVYTVTCQSESFSVSGFAGYVASASMPWLLMAFLCMLGFVLFEGLAILTICKALGYKRNVKSGLKYAASDIYFSAITPSATGGQPASAYFMMKDKIPGAVTTVILLINLTLYTGSIIIVGLVCLISKPDIFMNISILSKCMVVIGFVFQIILVMLFLMLVFREKIVIRIALTALNFLHRIHIIKNVEKKKDRLADIEKQYRECANAIKSHKKALAGAFFYNMLQRICLILVSVCVFIGVGGDLEHIYEAFIIQGYVVLGSNSIPVPGAVGVADYLFIDGFSLLIKDPVSIELLSRGISFYCCVIISGVITLVAYLSQGLKGMKRKKNDRIL